MMHRAHLPLFKPHITEMYTGPQIKTGEMPPEQNYIDAEKGRYIFLLDRSGSMQGLKIEIAK